MTTIYAPPLTCIEADALFPVDEEGQMEDISPATYRLAAELADNGEPITWFLADPLNQPRNDKEITDLEFVAVARCGKTTVLFTMYV